jgi:hypothetical protein
LRARRETGGAPTPTSRAEPSGIAANRAKRAALVYSRATLMVNNDIKNTNHLLPRPGIGWRAVRE